MTKEKKNKWISSGITTVSMSLLLLLLLLVGLTYEVPPPPPKEAILIELSAGGGGGGGATQVNKSQQSSASGENVATQNAVDAPSMNSSPKTNPKAETPKVDERSIYKGGKGGTGDGGGEGSGSGSGKGTGFGPGEGGGTGGSIGYGTGKRGYTYMPNLEIDNENGEVYVEVHVNEAGSVIEARIISNNKFPTTITNSKIQADCVARAKTARFNKGKEEFRIIMFK